MMKKNMIKRLLYHGEPGQHFAIQGMKYQVGDAGNFVNVDKDRRSKKERRRDAMLRRRAEAAR